MIHNLGKQNSIINQFVGELRNVNVQNDRMRFRSNMRRIGEIMAYEISKTLPFSEKEIVTPLGIADVPTIDESPVLATILRAGLPFHQGFMDIFDKSDCAFISAYRKHHKDGRFSINLEYVSCPNIEGKTLILADPMLATGSSLVLSAKALMDFGVPKSIHVATVITSAEGVNYVNRNLYAKDLTIWAAAIDEELTAQAYIVPGLGDAGDLAFGSKEEI